MASPFMQWAWHRAWAQSASAADVERSFAITFEGPGQSVRGILPFATRPLSFRRERVTALTWAIGDIGCPDHLDVPASSAVELDAAVPLLEELPWHVAVLSGVADPAPNVERLTDAFARRGYAVRRARLDSCPYIDLPNTWEDYLAGLSKSRRQAVRWQERKLKREYDVAITDYAPERVEEGLANLRTLHESRWAGAGTLGDARLDNMLRCFSSELAARSALWLTTLDLNGEPAAAWYGFSSGDTVYFYQSGRDPRADSASVGLVLLGAMIRRAIERGFRRFDFLRGCDAYKMSWSSGTRPIHEVVVFRPSLRGTWLRTLDILGRARARLRSRPEFAGVGD